MTLANGAMLVLIVAGLILSMFLSWRKWKALRKSDD